jgi:hypothetical protein
VQLPRRHQETRRAAMNHKQDQLTRHDIESALDALYADHGELMSEHDYRAAGQVRRKIEALRARVYDGNFVWTEEVS